MKTCFRCHRLLPEAEFYRHPCMADGLLGKCKACTRADVALNRWRNQDRYRAYDRTRGFRIDRVTSAAWRKQTPGAQAAHNAVARALRAGRMKRGPCVYCGAHGAHAHHRNYACPLDVEWVCVSCHRSHHAGMRGRTPWRLLLARKSA